MDLPYSTKNYIQYFVIICKKKSSERFSLTDYLSMWNKQDKECSQIRFLILSANPPSWFCHQETELTIVLSIVEMSSWSCIKGVLKMKSVIILNE